MPRNPERIQSRSSWEGDTVYQVYPYTFNDAWPLGEKYVRLRPTEALVIMRPA